VVIIIKDKFKKKYLLAVLLSVIVLAFLLFLVGMKSEELVDNSIQDGSYEGTAYDVNNIMSYYVESINSEGTLINIHYSSDDSEYSDITCLDCHDIDTLRELYYQVDEALMSEVKDSMNSSETTMMCLKCHGSYEELAELTADSTDFVDGGGIVANPHIYGGGLSDTTTDLVHTAMPCLTCHTSIHSSPDILTTAMYYCVSCHHTYDFYCVSCHE
jgi:hypothetical protein